MSRNRVLVQQKAEYQHNETLNKKYRTVNLL